MAANELCNSISSWDSGLKKLVKWSRHKPSSSSVERLKLPDVNDLLCKISDPAFKACPLEMEQVELRVWSEWLSFRNLNLLQILLSYNDTSSHTFGCSLLLFSY